MPRKRKNDYIAPEFQIDNKVLVFLQQTKIGKFLVALGILIAILIIDIFISADKLELFYIVLGIETLLAIVIGWSIYLIRRVK